MVLCMLIVVVRINHTIKVMYHLVYWKLVIVSHAWLPARLHKDRGSLRLILPGYIKSSIRRVLLVKLMLLLLLLLSRFSHVWLCATPQTAAHQALPSLGFSRQEHWSGLPFPSPMHESEKWKWSRSVLSDPQRPHGLQPSRLLHPWDFPGKSTGVGCHCLLRIYTLPYVK